MYATYDSRPSDLINTRDWSNEKRGDRETVADCSRPRSGTMSLINRFGVFSVLSLIPRDEGELRLNCF